MKFFIDNVFLIVFGGVAISLKVQALLLLRTTIEGYVFFTILALISVVIGTALNIFWKDLDSMTNEEAKE